jgi:hypothetical protein
MIYGPSQKSTINVRDCADFKNKLSRESWFIFNLRKINISTTVKPECMDKYNCTLGNATRINNNCFYGPNYTIIDLFILEWPSAWSTSPICPAYSKVSSLFVMAHSFGTWPSHSSWTVSHQHTSKQHNCHIVYTQTCISISYLYYHPLSSSRFFHYLGQADWLRPFLSGSDPSYLTQLISREIVP